MRPPTLSLTRRERALIRIISIGSGGSTGAAADRGLALGVLKLTLSVMFALNVLAVGLNDLNQRLNSCMRVLARLR